VFLDFFKVGEAGADKMEAENITPSSSLSINTLDGVVYNMKWEGYLFVFDHHGYNYISINVYQAFENDH